MQSHPVRTCLLYIMTLLFPDMPSDMPSSPQKDKEFLRSFSVQSKNSDNTRGSLRKRTMSAGSSVKEDTAEEEV